VHGGRAAERAGLRVPTSARRRGARGAPRYGCLWLLALRAAAQAAWTSRRCMLPGEAAFYALWRQAGRGVALGGESGRWRTGPRAAELRQWVAPCFLRAVCGESMTRLRGACSPQGGLMTSLFGSGNKKEEASDLLTEAANKYKIVKKWDKCGNCHKRVAQIQLELNDKVGARRLQLCPAEQRGSQSRSCTLTLERMVNSSRPPRATSRRSRPTRRTTVGALFPA